MCGVYALCTCRMISWEESEDECMTGREDQEECEGVWHTKILVYQEMLTSKDSVAVEDVLFL